MCAHTALAKTTWNCFSTPSGPQVGAEIEVSNVVERKQTEFYKDTHSHTFHTYWIQLLKTHLSEILTWNILTFLISGGWNNNPTVAHFQNYFRRIMVRCGIAPGKTGNVQPQDDTMCLSAVDMSSVVPAEDDDDNIASSPFQPISGVVLDHSYLATSFGCLTENALVYIAGFVVRQVMRKLACNVCRSSLVVSTIPSFGYNYHLLTLRNNGGLVIPSQGTVKVIRSAEHCIRRASNINSAAHQCPVSLLNRVVKAEVGSEDIFGLCDHIVDTQDGIDNHHFNLISLVVCTFHKLRQHHVAKVHSLQLQSKSLRKKLCKVVLLQGY